MSELASNIGVIPITVSNTTSATDFPRGTRLTNASGAYAICPDATTRGDVITLVDIPAGDTGAAALIAQGGISVLFDGAISSGALAYASTSSGMCSPTSASAALMGRCRQAVSSSGFLGEVLLFTVA